MLDWYYLQFLGKFKIAEQGQGYTLYHRGCEDYYKPKAGEAKKPPLLIIYSFISRSYGLFLDEEHSMIPGFLKKGMDVYILDWGDPVTIFSGKNGWKIEDFRQAISRIIDLIAAKNKVSEINLFSICAGTILVFDYLIHTPNPPIKKVLLNDAIIFGNRDLETCKTAELIGQTAGALEPFVRLNPLTSYLWDNFELNMPFVNWNFIIPSTSPYMITWYHEKILKEDGWLQYMKIMTWGLDDRAFPWSVWYQIVSSAFGMDEEMVRANFNKIDKKVRFFNLVGDDDFIVKPSASLVVHDEDQNILAYFDHQQIVDGGHFMFARKCNKVVEDMKEQAAKWLSE